MLTMLRVLAHGKPIHYHQCSKFHMFLFHRPPVWQAFKLTLRRGLKRWSGGHLASQNYKAASCVCEVIRITRWYAFYAAIKISLCDARSFIVLFLLSSSPLSYLPSRDGAD